MFRVSKDVKHIKGVIASVMPRDDLVSNAAIQSVIRMVKPFRMGHRGGIVMVSVRGMSPVEINSGHIELEIVRQVWVSSKGAKTMGWVVWARYTRPRPRPGPRPQPNFSVHPQKVRWERIIIGRQLCGRFFSIVVNQDLGGCHVGAIRR